MDYKQGRFADYDSHANLVPQAKLIKKCEVCGASPPSFIWTDYFGEAMCSRCGVPYQLLSPAGKQDKQVPYLALRKELIEPCRRYWREKGEFMGLGCRLGGSYPGLGELVQWLKENYPELIEKKEPEEQGGNGNGRSTDQ